jgi:hypothetical protein
MREVQKPAPLAASGSPVEYGRMTDQRTSILRSAAAIALGAVVLVGMLVIIMVAIRSFVPGGPADVPAAGQVVVSLAIGLLAEVPAGWVVGRIAPAKPYVHGIALVLFFSLMAGLQTGATGGIAVGAPLFLLNLLQIPGVLVGVWLAVRDR